VMGFLWIVLYLRVLAYRPTEFTWSGGNVLKGSGRAGKTVGWSAATLVKSTWSAAPAHML
jgi:hypothetical protein